MKKIDSVILVDSNVNSFQHWESQVSKLGITCKLTQALNGGHAFLIIEQLHLNERIKDSQILILLNLNTPIVNGIEFLEKYNGLKSDYKKNIKILILSENASDFQLSKVKAMGYSEILSPKLSLEELRGIFPGVRQENRTKLEKK